MVKSLRCFGKVEEHRGLAMLGHIKLKQGLEGSIVLTDYNL